MDLPSVFSKFNTKEKPPEKFLALEIGSETVTTAVWSVIQGKTQIISLGTTEDWEDNDKSEGLLAAIDNSLAKALEAITPEPNKVMFGLQELWVDGENIEKKYSKLLKEVCEKFEFTPVGFVVTTDAIIKLLKKQEGTPPSVILIRVNETELQVSVINLGRVVGTEIVARSEDIGADVEEGLARFAVSEKLPSKILLYNNNSNLERLKQDLLSYDWEDRLPFLHFPKVDIMEKQTPIKSVSLAGGADAAQSLGLEISSEADEEEESIPDQEPPPAPEEDSPLPVQTSEPAETAETLPTAVDQSPLISPASAIGFHSGFSHLPKAEISETEPFPTPRSENAVEPLPTETGSEETSVQPAVKERISTRLGSFSHRLKQLLQFIKHLRLPQVRISGNSRFKLAAISSLAFLVLLFTVGVFAYWNIPKAKLILYVRPKTLDKELTITIDSAQTEINLDKGIIPGKLVEDQAEGSKDKETTGTKIIGDKAVGEVILYNKTSASKTFPAGTTIIASSGLKFTLNSSVTVASASAQETDEGITTVFGKEKVSVTALAIGAEYNLPSNHDFSFFSLSSASYDAKNESVFTGGSSREVKAVSQADLDTLRDSLIQELKATAAGKLAQEEGFGMKILTEGAETEIESENFNHQVAEEAQSVSLTLKLKIKTIAYYQDYFDQLLHKSVSESIPENFEIREAESQTEISSVKFEDTLVVMEVLYKAILIPVIDEDEIKNNLKGRYPDIAKDYLKSLPNYSEVQIEITPQKIPSKLKTFPRKTKNITIEVKVESIP